MRSVLQTQGDRRPRFWPAVSLVICRLMNIILSAIFGSGKSLHVHTLSSPSPREPRILLVSAASPPRVCVLSVGRAREGGQSGRFAGPTGPSGVAPAARPRILSRPSRRLEGASMSIVAFTGGAMKQFPAHAIFLAAFLAAPA